jgi:hypothetical protein
VVNGVGGSGTVVSHPSGLSCSGPGTLCDSYYPVGTTLTLEAQPSSGLFLGWSLPGCPGVGECKLTLTNDVQIQATFATCHGFCPEQVPYGISGNLYGVGGTGVSSVLVAGDQGLLLQSTGNGKWTALPSGTTASLRAVAGATIGGKPLLYAVGDGGTILQWSGSLLSDLSRPALSSASLHAVGFGPGSSPNAYFLGDSGTVLQLPPGGTLNLQTLDNTVAGKTLNAVSQNPNSSSEDLYVVGNSGFSESWTPSGLPRETTQSSRLSQNLNAALCLSNYFYVAGDGGAISRRSSSGGNSNNWMVMTTPGTANLRGLWGSSASNLYAVGDGGTLWSSDGTSWSAVNTSTPQSLHAVWGTSSTNLYVVGDHATILHYLP